MTEGLDAFGVGSDIFLKEPYCIFVLAQLEIAPSNDFGSTAPFAEVEIVPIAFGLPKQIYGSLVVARSKKEFGGFFVLVIFLITCNGLGDISRLFIILGAPRVVLCFFIIFGDAQILSSSLPILESLAGFAHFEPSIPCLGEGAFLFE